MKSAQRSDKRAAAADDSLLACLVVIAKAHGANISPAVLLEQLGENQSLHEEGACRAMAAFGFRGAWSSDVGKFVHPAFCPFILKLGDGTFVVVREVIDGQAEVVDGTLQSTLIPFKDISGGAGQRVMLVVPPKLKDERAEVTIPTGKYWFWASLWRFRRSLLEGIALTVLVNVMALALTFMTMSVYDRVLPNQAYTTLWALGIGASISVAFEFLARSWRATVLDRVGKKIDILLGGVIFRHVMTMRLETQQGRSSGAFAFMIREYESVRDFVTSLTLTAVADLPFLLLFLGVMVYISGALAWVPVIGVAVVLVSLVVAQIPLSRLLRETLRLSAGRSGLVVEALSSLDSLKSLRAEGAISRQHDRFAAENADVSMRARLISNVLGNLSNAVQQFCTIAILIWGVYRVGENLATAGSIVASVMLMGRALQPLSSLTVLASRFQQARTSLESLNKIMMSPLERQPGLSYFHRPKWEGTLEVARLTFRYGPKSPPVSDNMTFSVAAGERIGIIGRMGSGKSTLLKLLAGLYQPVDGEIVLDGLDMRHVDVMDVRRTVRMLTQDVKLMQGSLVDNLRLAAPHCSDDQMLEAAKLTGVLEFARTHPLGMNMPVGEGGRMLSGGQRQAVALTQVLLSDARVLLLDEPTESMDQASERAICAAITQVTKGRTMLLVTHKASLLHLVDRLLVIERGRIVLDGPRDAVLRHLSGGNTDLSGANERASVEERTAAPAERVFE